MSTRDGSLCGACSWQNEREMAFNKACCFCIACLLACFMIRLLAVRASVFARLLEEEEEQEGEEQVVPWTAEPPPVASSSSSEEESVGRIGGGLLKRMRGNVDLPSSSSCSQDQLPCSSYSSRLSYLPNQMGVLSPVRNAADDEATSDSFRPLKDRKKSDLIRAGSHGFSAISFGSARPPI